MMDQDQYCAKCEKLTQFRNESMSVDIEGYSSFICMDCSNYGLFQCQICDQLFAHRNHDYRAIKNHMKKKHGWSQVIGTDNVGNTLKCQENDDCPPLRNRTRNSDEYNDCDANELCEDSDDIDNPSFTNNDNDISTLLDVDYDDCVAHYEEVVDWRDVMSFGNDVSNTFFEQDFKMFHEHGQLNGGLRGACWRSRYRLDLYGPSNVASMTDTTLMFNITNLLVKSPASSNNLLFEIIDDLMDRMEGDFDSNNPEIRIPRNHNDAVRSCLGGQYGIFNNLPCPSVHHIGGHACMKIGDIISQHMAIGRGFLFTVSPSTSTDNDINNGQSRIYEGIHGCIAMSELIESMQNANEDGTENSYYGWITTWSDSFLRSYVKQKLNNVWMYTITLPDPDQNSLSPFHTYCVAAGSGNLDHTPVIDWYSKELTDLMKGKNYYCGQRKITLHAKIGVVAVLADRPEKAFVLKTSLLGIHGRMASWAADIDPDILSDCKECFKRRLSLIFNDRHSCSNLSVCHDCCQWDLDSTSASVKRIAPPERYPHECEPDSPDIPVGREMRVTHIRPIKQTFEWLTKAVLLAAHNVKSGCWKKGVMDSYLRTCAVATSVRDLIWMVCRPGSLVANAIQNENENELPIGIENEIEDGYVPILGTQSNVVPALWYSPMLMNSYLDCGMHLVFHGIVAYCVERIEEFMVDQGLTQKFDRLVNTYLIDIQALRLDWCKMKFLPKKQWLAENELAFARIIPFVYGLFFMNLELPERTNTSIQSQHAIQQMVHSLHVMICILMSPRNPGAEEIEEHVKIFLSCCHRFSRSYYDRSEVPFWARTGNFPTLLCLAEQRRRHGPIRWYWEGTSERFIQKLKKVLTSMRRTTQYFEGKLKLLHKTYTMEWYDGQLRQEANREAGTETTFRKNRNYFQYTSKHDIDRKMMLGEVLSAFTFFGNTNKLFVAFGEKRRRGLMDIIGITRLDDGITTKCLGLPYMKCSFDNDTDILVEMDVEEIESQIQHHCLLLPLIDDGNFIQEFAIVYDDWDISNEKREKSMSYLCTRCFETDVL